jgi:TetR/AcrR family transcriptional regulator
METAKELFIEKGYDGTTMQAIADASKVTKALVHYYYQSKDNLFLRVFREELDELSRSMASLWEDKDRPLVDRLDAWIDSQAELISRSPRLPLFIISEMARNPALITELLLEFAPPEPVLLSPPRSGQAEERMEFGTVSDLICALSALVFFPAIAAPFIRPLMGGTADYEEELFAAQVRLAKGLVRRLLPETR